MRGEQEADPAARANSHESYKRAQERGRAEAAKRASAHAHGPMPPGKQDKPCDRNNTSHD